MTDAISFVPISNPGAGAGTAGAQNALADNFDTFLTILTAQIQNQDPLEPMDSSKFTDQLVQFSGVEQQIKSNKQLEELLAATYSSAGASLSGYLGQQAEIATAGAQLTGDSITWKYELPADAAKATITVTDASGKVLYSRAATADELNAGSHGFEWDGTLKTGGKAEEGEPYWINVVAEDANGKSMTPNHSLVTTITGVDLTYGEPALTTPAGIFAYADIKRLMRQ
jgi:flagellar basal-body rod modification protein FlgD